MFKYSIASFLIILFFRLLPAPMGTMIMLTLLTLLLLFSMLKLLTLSLLSLLLLLLLLLLSLTFAMMLAATLPAASTKLRKVNALTIVETFRHYPDFFTGIISVQLNVFCFLQRKIVYLLCMLS